MCVGGGGGELAPCFHFAAVVFCLNRAAAPRSVPGCALRAQKASYVTLGTRVPRSLGAGLTQIASRDTRDGDARAHSAHISARRVLYALHVTLGDVSANPNPRKLSGPALALSVRESPRLTLTLTLTLTSPNSNPRYSRIPANPPAAAPVNPSPGGSR